MDYLQKAIFRNRKSIIDNADLLLKYGRTFQKGKITNQLSLFNTNTIELDKPSIDDNELSDGELELMADLEVSTIGLPLTYNKYNNYILTERIIRTTTFNDVIYCTKDNSVMDFIAEVELIDYRNSKWGNPYAKIHFKRDGISSYMYLTGSTFKDTISEITTNSIYIVKCKYNNRMHTIIKMKLVSKIDVSDRVKSIKIIVSNKNNLDKIRNYVFAKMRSNEGINYKFNILDQDYDMNERIEITGYDIAEIEKRGAVVEINK